MRENPHDLMYLLVEGKKDVVSIKSVVLSVGQSENLGANIYKLPNGLQAFFLQNVCLLIPSTPVVDTFMMKHNLPNAHSMYKVDKAITKCRNQ